MGQFLRFTDLPCKLNAWRKAANLIGKGLYGVDLKMVDDKAYVIEINDNPSIDHELEDAIIGDEMYYRLLNHFEQALEMKHY